MGLSKQLYFFSGAICSTDTQAHRRRYIDATKDAYDPFEAQLIRGLKTRGAAIRDYGLSLGYFAPLINGNLATHSVYDKVYFEILGTHDALLYIFPGGENRPFSDDYSVRISAVTPVNNSTESERHANEMRDMKEWMQNTHKENLHRIDLGYCNYDE